MKLSRASTYAFYGLTYLATQPDRLVPLPEISSRCGVPDKHLAKIFQSLVRAGILTSARGVNGGFSLARAPDEISPLEVIEVVDGPVSDSGCLLLGVPCDRGSVCRINAVWRRAQHQMLAVLREATLADMVPGADVVMRPPRPKVPGARLAPPRRRLLRRAP
jgi:Rrf2 family protein